MAQTTTTTPWAAEGLTLSSREEKLAHFLLSRAARPAGRPSADTAARTRAPISRDAGAAPAALRHEVVAPRPRGLTVATAPPRPKQERRLKKTYYDGLGRKDPSKNDD